MMGCPLSADKDLKKLGRGSHASRTDANSGFSVTKWLDNKDVQVITNFCDVNATIALLLKPKDGTSKSFSISLILRKLTHGCFIVVTVTS